MKSLVTVRRTCACALAALLVGASALVNAANIPVGDLTPGDLVSLDVKGVGSPTPTYGAQSYISAVVKKRSPPQPTGKGTPRPINTLATVCSLNWTLSEIGSNTTLDSGVFDFFVDYNASTATATKYFQTPQDGKSYRVSVGYTAGSSYCAGSMKNEFSVKTPVAGPVNAPAPATDYTPGDTKTCPAPYADATENLKYKGDQTVYLGCVKHMPQCPEGFSTKQNAANGDVVCIMPGVGKIPGWNDYQVHFTLHSLPQPLVACPRHPADYSKAGTDYYKESWDQMGCRKNPEVLH